MIKERTMMGTSSRRLAAMAALLLAVAAGGCDKPSAGECRKAIENIRAVLGTSQQSEFASATDAWVRSCRGSAKRKAVKCAIESASVEALRGCGLISAKEIDELIELDRQLKQLEPPVGSGAGSGTGAGSGSVPAADAGSGSATGSAAGSGSATGSGSGSATAPGSGSAAGSGSGMGTGTGTGS